MRTQKKSFIGLALIVHLIFGVDLIHADEFDQAIKKANEQKVTVVHEVKTGLPYYTLKNLDPIWTSPSDPNIVTVKNIDLIDQNSAQQNQSMFDGKITVVAFFFSSCAGFCPMLIQNLKKIEKIAADMKIKNMQYVAVTVDPDVDTPSNMKKYHQKMKLNENWKLLTGSDQELYHFSQEIFAAEVFKLPKSKGQFGHSEHFYVLDKNRQLRGILNGTNFKVSAQAKELFTEMIQLK